MPSLFVIQGRDRGHRFELETPVVSIGRDISNTIRLQDTEVSRQHAEILLTDGGVELIDLESSNGTFVNGERTRRTKLSSADQVQFGRTLLLYTAGSQPVMDDLNASIDILPTGVGDESRIVRSMTHEQGGDDFADIGLAASDSPWLARRPQQSTGYVPHGTGRQSYFGY